MKKISFKDVLIKVRGKVCEIDSDMFDKPERHYQSLREKKCLGFGFIALNHEDNYWEMADGRIKYKSLDDGNGYIKIV